MGRVEAALLNLPQVPVPVVHRFAKGLYWREIFAPAGTIVIGHEHKHEHFAIILKGSCLIAVGGEFRLLQAPNRFVGQPGSRKVAYVVEDMTFATVHANPDDETDLEVLEDELTVKSPEWLCRSCPSLQ